LKGKVVLELGPGTGVFTKEILKVLPRDGILISIDSNKDFIDYLSNKIDDTRLKLVEGDAREMREILNKYNIQEVDFIVSGLPLGHFGKELKNQILSCSKDCLKQGGKYVQFEYLLAGYKSVKEVFPTMDISFEIFNLPPAFVMECTRT
jgi:phospholipid N-methyltransferase